VRSGVTSMSSFTRGFSLIADAAQASERDPARR
jgi:hypothetical protein